MKITGLIILLCLSMASAALLGGGHDHDHGHGHHHHHDHDHDHDHDHGSGQATAANPQGNPGFVPQPHPPVQILPGPTAPRPQQQPPVQTLPRPATSPATGQTTTTDNVFTISVNGITLFDRHACIFRNGELRLRGTRLEFDGKGVFEVLAGFAILSSGDRVSIDGGLIEASLLRSTDTRAVSFALSQAGLTINQFIQQTGTIPPQQGVIVVEAGVLAINGVYRNVNAGIMVIVYTEGPGAGGPQPINPGAGRPGTSPGTGGPQPTFPGTGGPQPTFPGTGGPQPTFPGTGGPGPLPGTGGIIVTETAVPVTRTVRQTVTLAKTLTRDNWITRTSPVYNTLDATVTDFTKETITVPTYQVIRSPLPGRVVVNAVPINSQTVLTVRGTATNFFMETIVDTETATLQHVVPQFSFRTVTVNNPQTSTVVQVITRTSVSTTLVTNTLTNTRYTTTVINTSGSTDTPIVYY